MTVEYSTSLPEIGNRFEKEAVTLETRVGNTLTLLTGDRWLRPETRIKPGLFDNLEQNAVSLDQITTESEDGSTRSLDYFKVAEAGRGVASNILGNLENGGKSQVVNLVAGLCALRELVASHQAGAGKVIGENGDARDAMPRIPVYNSETKRTEYLQTNIRAFDAVSEMLERYDLDNVIAAINNSEGATPDTDSRLAVACLLYALSSPTQTLESAYSKASIESGLTPMSFKEMLFLSNMDRTERRNRDTSAGEIVKDFCTDDFGFIPVKGLYFDIENQGWGDNKIMNGVAMTVAEDQTVYAITDQGEMWRKNREEKWEPFVIKRKGLSGGEVFSVATTADLKNGTIEEIQTIENDNLYVDFRAVKTGKPITPRGDVVKFDQGSLEGIHQNQVAEKRKIIAENLEEIQGIFGIIEHFDESEYKKVTIIREDGKKEEVLMIGKSENLMTDRTKFIELEDADSFPQVYIDQDGQVYTQLIKKTEDGRYVAVNLDKKGEKLAEVAQKDAIYYDTGLNVSFLDLQENQPNGYYWTIEKQSYEKGKDSFVLFRFLFDESTYGKNTARLGVGFRYGDNDQLISKSDEQYRALDFVAKPKGEIASGQGERVQEESLVDRFATTIHRIKTGKEKPRVSTISTTNLDKLSPGKRKERMTLGATKLKAMKRQFGGQWVFSDVGEKITYKKQPGERFEGKHRFNQTKDAWIFAKIADPKQSNATLLFDLDGNIFRRDLSSGVVRWVQNGKPEKLLK